MPLIDDRFSNIIGAQVVQSAANTDTFVEIATGVSLGQQMGIVIDEIRYYPARLALQEIVGTADQLLMALTTSSNVADFTDPGDTRILDVKSLQLTAARTAESNLVEVPLLSSFNPPIIVAAPSLFFGVETAGFGAAATVRFRLSYRFIKLTTQEYLEVAETFLIQS